METIFKEGDKVFDIQYGWGIVKRIDFDANYPIFCRFDNYKQCYSIDGKIISGAIPTLSFTEYTLEGFSQERPEPLPKPGDIVWVRSNPRGKWHPSHFIKKENKKYFASINYHWYNMESYPEMITVNPYANEQ
jgi:hypothetical protein